MMAFVVPDYDEAIAYFVDRLGFALLEDTPLGEGKRWVRVGPQSGGFALLLAKADAPQQTAVIGGQAGGRVLLFLRSADFDDDYARMVARGVRFVEAPRHESYGKVCVFEDRWGNLWDLIEQR